MKSIRRLVVLPVLFLTAPAPRASAAAGDLDTLNANVLGLAVYGTAVQPDGKIMVAGIFSEIGGMDFLGPELIISAARLNTNGTADTGFSPPSSPGASSMSCRNVAVKADGRILASGLSNQPRYYPFLTNGSFDPSFGYQAATPGANSDVWCSAIQADGRILLGGSFTIVNDVSRNRIVRLEANGPLDQSFNPNANGPVNCMAVQPDGKILIGGAFTTVGGVARSYIARLNADGTLDTGFDPNANNAVVSLAVQADGRILIGGNFTTVSGVTRTNIARLETTGAVDMGFNPTANNVVRCIAVQADGRILLGGVFTTMGGTLRNRIARVNANGTLDTGFDPNVNNIVHTVSLQSDGMVLLGGTFTTLQPNGAAAATTRNRLARLLNDPATQTLSVLDTAHLLWTRGGAGPELSRVTFELSTDGGATWGAPMAATRAGTTANWHLSGGFALPASGQLRAHGVTISGYQNGSSGLIEQVASFSGILNASEITVVGNGLNIADGDSTPGTTDGTEFHAAFGATTAVHTFTITNSGTAALNLTGTPKVVVSGVNAADFAVTLQPGSPVAATNGTTTFQVTFTPGAAGVRNATLSIASDDADEATFDFAVTGRGLSYTTDTDGDGMNDASELQLRTLGFDWATGGSAQQQLVATYYAGANGAGLYTTSQVQALHMDVPLLQRTPGTNTFTFTFGPSKSTTLAPGSFVPFPFTPAGTSVNGAGKVQYQFTAPDNAAFFRLEMP